MAGTKGRSGGRNRIPADVHLLRGTFDPSRHADAPPTLDAPSGRPDARDLTGEARREFDRMCDRLDAIRILSVVDDAVLRRYALLHADTEALTAERRRLVRLSAKLTKAAGRLEGKELAAVVGQIVQLEKLAARQGAALRQGAQALRQWLVELGMTPSARTRVHAAPIAHVAPTVDAAKRKYLDALTRTS